MEATSALSADLCEATTETGCCSLLNLLCNHADYVTVHFDIITRDCIGTVKWPSLETTLADVISNYPHKESRHNNPKTSVLRGYRCQHVCCRMQCISSRLNQFSKFPLDLICADTLILFWVRP